MKKIIAIILLVISLLTFVSCNKKDTQTESVKYPLYNSNFLYKGFLNELEKRNEEVGEDFFVLAPQDYSITPRWDLIVQEESSKEESRRVKDVLVCQNFYVCNEEKYGRQVTDWGQYSEIAINFKVQFSSNAQYEPKLGENIIIKHINAKSNNNVNYADLYQGETCFASIGFEFCEEVPTEENRKIYVENYIKDCVMPYSEYKIRKENGEFKKAVDIESRDMPKGKPAYSQGLIDVDRVESDITEIAKYNLPTLYIDIFSGEIAEQCKNYSAKMSVRAKDLSDDGEFEEIKYYCTLEIYLEELGGKFVPNLSTNFILRAVFIPLYIEEFDLDLISLEKTNDITYFNLYYDGFCCGTINCFDNSEVLETSEEKYEYFENFLKTYLRYYNPNEEVEQAN